MPVTVIRNASWIVAYDEASESHVYLKGGDDAYDGSRIVQVGGHYDGPVKTTIDGTGRLVIARLSTSPLASLLRGDDEGLE